MKNCFVFIVVVKFDRKTNEKKERKKEKQVNLVCMNVICNARFHATERDPFHQVVLFFHISFKNGTYIQRI